jgi:hypothetical protein
VKRREPFAFDERELSDDARAILAYARQWGAPFTRREITDLAPGAAWDEFSRYPKTVADVDPIRELVRAGLVVEHDEQPVKSDRRMRRHYKRWALAGDGAPRSLAELLDEMIGTLENLRSRDHVEQLRAEILRRFGRPGGES